MQFIENIKLALAGIRTSKMRSILTMLGIIIGIAAVIGIASIGDSLTGQITGTMGEMGANNIYIMLSEKKDEADGPTVQMPGMASVAKIPTDSDLITPQIMQDLITKFDDEIGAYSYSVGVSSGQVKDGRKIANMSMIGVNSEYGEANQIELKGGRFIRENDIRGEKNVAVISDKLANRIFGSGDPLGKEIKAYSLDRIDVFTVVGVYEYEMPSTAAMMGMTADDKDLSTEIYIPVTTGQTFVGNQGKGFDTFIVTAATGTDIEGLSLKIQNSMVKLYEKNHNFTVQTMSMESMLDQMNSILGTVSIAIAAIAAISLLVGGVGVMNIMLVSVTERTREIGTRKALGARQNDIRAQFIIESIILCLIGGLIGIILGLGLGSLGAMIIGSPSVPSVTAIALAVTFSMAIGVFFGYYPANKAAKLDPIEALRYE